MPEFRSDVKNLPCANARRSMYETDIPQYQITKKKEATPSKIGLGILRSVTSTNRVLNDLKKDESSLRPVDWDAIRKEILKCSSQEKECEESTDDYQYKQEDVSTTESEDAKDRISTDDSSKDNERTSTNTSQSVRHEAQISICNSNNVEYKKPDVLISHYEKPNLRYLIVENVKKNKEQYFASQEGANDSSYDFKSNGPQIFTAYNRKFLDNMYKKQKTGKDKYICKLPVCRTESVIEKTVYYLDQSIRCQVCYEEMAAEYNLFATGDTLMIGETFSIYVS